MCAVSEGASSLGSRSTRVGYRALLPLSVFTLVLLCLLPGSAAPWAGTEGHRALPGRAMLDGGDWLVPRLVGQLYLRKPPGQYWAIASAGWVACDVTERVSRLPSMLGAALLAAVVAVWARRWFGGPAGWLAGLAQLSLLAMWSQSRSADIDSLNNLAVLGCTVALIEVHAARNRWRWAWSAVLFVAFAAMLLLKGPAGLPLVMGAWLAPMLIARRGWRRVAHPASWVPMALGALPLAGWGLLVKRRLASTGESQDTRGVQELGNYLGPQNAEQWMEALLLPWQLAVFALPVTAVLLLLLPGWLKRSRDGLALGMRVDARRVVCWLLTALGVAVVIGVAANVRNPRYVYAWLPVLSVLIGAVGSGWVAGWFDERRQAGVRMAATVFTAVLPVGAVVLSVLTWPGAVWQTRVALALTGLCTVGVGLVTLVAWWRRRPEPGLLGIAALLLLLAVPFGYWEAQKRGAQSGLLVASDLEQIVAVRPAPVRSGLVVFHHPELFAYAGLWPEPVPRPDGDWSGVTGPAWLVLQEVELEALRRSGAAIGRPAELYVDEDRIWVVPVWRQAPPSADEVVDSDQPRS